MQDYAFDPVYLRGLGSPPPPPQPLPLPPSPSASAVEGLGQEPEGLGQGKAAVWATMPPGMHVTSPQGHSWLLAFVSGSRRPNVSIAGRVGFSYQKAINYFAAHAGRGPVFFTFTNKMGTYLFAFETVSNRYVIKLCTDGMHVTQTPGGRAPWRVSFPSQLPSLGSLPVGVGAIFKTPPVYSGHGIFSGGGIQINPLSRKISGGTWASLGTVDSGGNFAPNDPTGQLAKASDLQSTLNNWASNIADTSAGYVIDGYFYFGLSDSNTGAAQTPGEPPGMAIMRWNASSNALDMLINESGAGTTAPTGGGGTGAGTTAPTGGGGTGAGAGATGINVVLIKGPVPPYTGPFQSGTPTSPGLWWYNMMWVYVGSIPPPTVYPPGNQPLNAGDGNLGRWLLTAPNHWVWFPAGPGRTSGVPTPKSPIPTPVGMIGGDGQTYWVVSNDDIGLGLGPPSALPMPTAPPPGAAPGGTWQNPTPGYYVYGASAALAPAATSYTWLWVLLGVAAVGGVGYYLLD